MIHNKGKHYINCKECNRKRYCLKVSIPDFKVRWTCSKGHSWVIEIGDVGKVVAMEMERILPNLKNLFERDNAFYRTIKK